MEQANFLTIVGDKAGISSTECGGSSVVFILVELVCSSFAPWEADFSSTPELPVAVAATFSISSEFSTFTQL